MNITMTASHTRLQNPVLFSAILAICLSIPAIPGLQAQIKTQVVLAGGANEITRSETGKALSAVLQEANRVAEGAGDLASVRSYFTEAAFDEFSKLVAATGLFSTASEIRTRILQTANGKYEVRGVRVRVRLGETQGDDVQELVFVLNFRLFIENVHFAMESHHFSRLVEEGKALKDMALRQQVLGFLESFRTAHNRKDLNYLERAYSDDALIIVGRVLETQQDAGDMLTSSSLGEEKIEFIKLSKKQYVERLAQVFQNNDFVRVTFDKVDVIRHSKFPEIYGIKLRQRWNSSTYSDEGYLFVMMDFYDPKRPLIHVRAWQPEPFGDGSVVGLGDFEIIE